MTFKLPERIQAKLNADRQAEIEQRVTFANLSNTDLAASAKFWMQHCVAPKRIEAGTPVYDSTFWHIIVLEMMRRLTPSYAWRCNCAQPGLGGDCDGSCTHPPPTPS